MSYSRALWLSLLVLTAHNIEEYYAIPYFFAHSSKTIPVFARCFVQPPSSETFLSMLVMVTLLATVLIYIATRPNHGERGHFWGLVLVMAGFLANGLNHLGMVFITHTYVPGVVTAILLLLPYSLYLIQKSQSEQQTNLPTLVLCLITGIALLLPTIFATRALASLVLI